MLALMCGGRTALYRPRPFPRGFARKPRGACAIKLDRSLSGASRIKVGEALDYHGRHLGEVGVAALKAFLHELIDLTVQTVGHLIPLLAAGRIRPAHSAPFSKAAKAV